MALPFARDPSEPFTLGDLDAMPDDGHRWELIDGSLIVSPAPPGAHQWCAGQLFGLLHEACTPDTVVMPAPYDWRAAATGESFQPDLTVIRRDDFDPDGPLRATPLLVAEVISSGGETLDRVLKRARYEALAVPAYWIVNPAGPSLTELRLAGGGYTEETIVTGGATFTTGYPFSVELIPRALAWPG